MIYNKISATKDLAETNLEPTKKQEEMINFLEESQGTQQKTYLYPSLDESTSWIQYIMSSHLNAISLVPSVKFVIFSLFLLAFYIGLFGVIILGVSLNILETKIAYGSKCHGQSTCTLTFDLESLFPTPVYVYYELDEFYSNEERFFKSINKEQLEGHEISNPQEKCKNAYLQSDMPITSYSAAGYVMNRNYANPCGLAAKYTFNDTFIIFNSDGVKVINSTSLTLPMYVDNFQRSQQFQFSQWLDVKDERVVSWLTPQMHSSRYILWGVINANMYAGSYKLYINNMYPTEIFDGEKILVLSSASELGTRNSFLGYLLCAASGLLIIVATFIFSTTRSQQQTQIKPEEINYNQSSIQGVHLQNISNTQFVSLSQSQIQTAKLKYQ